MKVLFPIDENRTAEEILEYVQGQNWLKTAQIRLLCVIQPIEMYTPLAPIPAFSETVYEQMNSWAQGLLLDVAGKLRAMGYTSVEAETALGDPAHTIIDEVKSWKPDLVVVGTHNRKGLEKVIMGSVSEAVAANAGCSVLVLRQPEASVQK